MGLKFIELLKSHEGNTKASEPDEWAYSFRSMDLLGQVAIIFNRPANVGWVSDSLANANEPCPWKGFGQLMQYHHQREKLMNDVWLRVEECFFTNEIESMSEAVDLFDGLVDKAPETVRASGILSPWNSPLLIGGKWPGRNYLQLQELSWGTQFLCRID